MALAGIWCQIIDCISLSIECIFTEKKKKLITANLTVGFPVVILFPINYNGYNKVDVSTVMVYIVSVDINSLIHRGRV